MIIYIPFIFIEYGAHSENGNQIDHEYLIVHSYTNYSTTGVSTSSIGASSASTSAGSASVSGNKTTFT